MKQPEELKQRKQLTLQVISPIHIGSGEGILRTTDFLVSGNQVFILDEDKLGEFLLAKGLLPRLMTALQQGPLNLAAFLKEAGEVPEKIAPLISRTPLPGGAPTMQEFRPLIRDGQNQVYLPGSALKGVIRTAVLYKIMREHGWMEKISKKIQEDPPCQGKGRERRQKTVYYSESLLQKQALQNFTLPHRDVTRDPTTDILRCLMVRDAYPVDPQGIYTGVIAIEFLSKRGDGSFYFSNKKTVTGKLVLWAEAILRGNFKVELVWNKELFAQFQKNNPQAMPVQSLADVLAAIQEMNRDVIDHEISHYTATLKKITGGSLNDALKAQGQQDTDPAAAASAYLKKFYDSRQQKYLRVGFGSGMLSTTVGLHLPPEVRQKIRDHCGSGPRPGDPAPKSRRIWRQVKKGTAFPLGWMQLVDNKPE